jgi:hypothetical protein
MEEVMRLLTIGAMSAVFALSGVTAARSAPAAAGVDEVRPTGSGTRSAVHEVTLPAGTRLPIVLENPVGSDISRVEQPVRAHLSTPVRLRGETVLPRGSRVTGIVTDATRSGKVKGRAHVGIRFDSVVSGGDDTRYELWAAPIGRVAPGTKKKDALEIGLPAAGGAVVGGLIGGGKGAAIGSAAGGGAGTAVVLSTRGKEVRLPRGTPLTLRLTAPLTIRVRS